MKKPIILIALTALVLSLCSCSVAVTDLPFSGVTKDEAVRIALDAADAEDVKTVNIDYDDGVYCVTFTNKGLDYNVLVDRWSGAHTVDVVDKAPETESQTANNK